MILQEESLTIGLLSIQIEKYEIMLEPHQVLCEGDTESVKVDHKKHKNTDFSTSQTKHSKNPQRG